MPAAAVASPPAFALTYERRDPSAGPLHRLLSDKLEGYLEARVERPLPGFVVDALRGYLRCGVLRHGFARFRCDDCAQSRLVALSRKQRAFCPRCVGRKMADQAKHLVEDVLPPVPFRQWVLSFPHVLGWRMAHNHELYGEGVFHKGAQRLRNGKPRAPSTFARLKAHEDGFDLDAHVTVAAGARASLEQLVRYILRPPLKETRLTLHATGVELTLKTPWSDGTTQIRLTPDRFIDRLVALVPPPRVNTLLYGGLFAANARLRPLAVTYQRPGVTPRKRTRPAKPSKPRNIAWAELMRYSFGLDVLACPHCGGRMRHVATVLDHTNIERILRHQGLDAPEPRARSSPLESDLVYEPDEHALADAVQDDFSQLDPNDPW